MPFPMLTASGTADAGLGAAETDRLVAVGSAAQAGLDVPEALQDDRDRLEESRGRCQN